MRTEVWAACIIYPYNITILTLISKVNNAMLMKDFRSIACCNLLYKFYPFIITNRLNTVIPYLISSNRIVFIQEQSITNVLSLHEIMRGYSRTSGKACVVLKGEIMKAMKL